MGESKLLPKQPGKRDLNFRYVETAELPLLYQWRKLG
jgi:hypothetical protein